ncbi:glutathione S-transferase [Marinomonas sp. TW1]|uniref:glutathione S-transferase n=1 Tax=Marinomonas sp. TW1 TaxID=1561203 RepID=UPI0007AF497C|nr:glutathione S-transferase [Marinomonas sp. TW1]KZN12308.1 glutathione S-transferase [Marinomonas sp. TW1]
MPILYSFRRCPYAIRARYVLALLGCDVLLREVDLKSKPSALLALGGRTTVPQMIDEQGERYPESMDIMLWALKQTARKELAELLWPSPGVRQTKINTWISYNDNQFKYWLDRYKYADRYPDKTELEYRQRAEVFMKRLNNRLSLHKYLLGDDMSLADIAIFPFIRQFSNVDKNWFETSEYDNLKLWLDSFVNDDFFNDVIMKKLPSWQNGQADVVFPFCQ